MAERWGQKHKTTDEVTGTRLHEGNEGSPLEKGNKVTGLAEQGVSIRFWGNKKVAETQQANVKSAVANGAPLFPLFPVDP